MMDRKQLRASLAALRQLRLNPPPFHTEEWTKWLDELIARNEERLDPRLGLTRRLPKFAQPFLTILTGKAGDEKSLWTNTALGVYLGNLATLSLSLLTATGLLLAVPDAVIGGKLLLSLGAGIALLTTAGTVRAGVGVYLHHSTHGTYPVPALWQKLTDWRLAAQGEAPLSAKRTARESWNRFLGETLSTLILAAPFDAYRRDHMIHHGHALATWDDPDWKFLFRFGGFRPGQSVKEYWKRLFKTLLSPRYHGQFLRARLLDNLFNPERRCIAA